MALDPSQRGLAGIAFLTAATNAMDVYSAVNSSPWTAETVSGGDPEKEASLRRYCLHAIGQTVLLNGFAAAVSGDLWPYIMAGAGLEVTYMSWLYWDAVKRGRKTKSAEGNSGSYGDVIAMPSFEQAWGKAA